MKASVAALLLASSVAAMPASIALATGTGAIEGAFALQTDTPRAHAHLSANELRGNPLERQLDTWLTYPGSSRVIRSYRVDMTKYLHMIVISDDFRTFMHVHPKLKPDGHFLLDQSFPHPGRYHVYTDTTPAGDGQQVFRFDLNLGSATRTSVPILGPPMTTGTAGPYRVNISSDQLSISSESQIAVHIFKDGRPAGDLHPYLGALAHAVFINERDLSYVHVHPHAIQPGAASPNATAAGTADSDMRALPSSEISSPNMLLRVAVHEPGTYKLWLQFRGGSALYVASFVLTAT
ncbi:MAG TPA: hypothetical protein VGF86_00105 [Candidatus Tumulicola sp.]|jgi:hypothetical protein